VQHLPALKAMKAWQCRPGSPWIYPVIYDEKGNVVEAGSGRAGIFASQPIGQASFQTIWASLSDLCQIYYEKYCRNKESKDWRDCRTSLVTVLFWQPTGYFRILAGRRCDQCGRHRLERKRLESASLTVERLPRQPRCVDRRASRPGSLRCMLH